MVIRDKIFSTITSVFKRHGAVTIDTLVFRSAASPFESISNPPLTARCLS